MHFLWGCPAGGLGKTALAVSLAKKTISSPCWMPKKNGCPGGGLGKTALEVCLAKKTNSSPCWMPSASRARKAIPRRGEGRREQGVKNRRGWRACRKGRTVLAPA